MKIAFIIVVYNKQLEFSETINSLLRLGKEKKFSCCIVNNGPCKIDFLDDGLYPNVLFDFNEYMGNLPLSYLYNGFLKKYQGYDRLVILDDDSILTESFIDRVFTEDSYDIELPKIYNKDGKLFYPLKKWSVIESSEDNFEIKDVVFSIGSGLVIGESVIKTFNSKGMSIFNESFAFYGVDFSFFWELQRIGCNFNITSKSSIIHDMSLHGIISDFKLQELYVNFVLQFRYYPSVVNFKNFVYSFLNSIRNRKFDIIKEMMKALITGKHKRCRGRIE